MTAFVPKVFILDVDGVMNTVHFLYSADGKLMKIFGADDNDGLSLTTSVRPPASVSMRTRSQVDRRA
jgi:3-deoxy-D-manno-octulosonate 8-phosphate phosphatase KdsC-like HAD superfamily phosphatase